MRCYTPCTQYSWQRRVSTSGACVRERPESVREMQPLAAFEGNNIETEEPWARRLVQQVGEQKVALDSCARPRCAPTNWVAGLLFGTEAQVLAPMIGPGG